MGLLVPVGDSRKELVCVGFKVIVAGVGFVLLASPQMDCVFAEGKILPSGNKKGDQLGYRSRPACGNPWSLFHNSEAVFGQ